MDNSLTFSINLNGTAYKGTVKLDAAMEKLTASVKKTESAMGGLITRSVGFEAMASLATRAFNAVVTPMKKMLDVGSESELQLQNMISLYKGNADAAQDMYGRLSEFGRTTVYDKKSLIDAQKTMMSFGISGEKAYNTLRQIGDIAMGDSQKMKSLALAFSQATSAGKLGGQDLMQLINAGFNPLQTISERTGKSRATLKDEMSRGLCTAATGKIPAMSFQCLYRKWKGLENKMRRAKNLKTKTPPNAIITVFNKAPKHADEFKCVP